MSLKSLFLEGGEIMIGVRFFQWVRGGVRLYKRGCMVGPIGLKFPVKKMARPEGFEPTTLGSEDRCSIH